MKNLAFLLLILSVMLTLKASAYEQERPAICLNMIVKNESHVIRRCLESVKPLIDYWVIVDTGSEDGTQEIIKEYMKEIPGELYERPWVDFAYSRNEALDLARDKAQYLLIIDADDKLSYSPDFMRSALDKDCYFLKIRYGGINYDRIQLINTDLNWQWEGVVHEALVCDTPFSSELLEGVTMVIVGGGGRSHDPKKFLKDIALLEKALEENPYHARNLFYLAQSYSDAGMPETALKIYEKRVALGGWDEELYIAMYRIAQLQEALNMPEETVIRGYWDAFHFRPTRAEPLYHLSQYYRLKENYLLGYLLSQHGLQIDPPPDFLFVESWIYEYGLLLEFSISSYWIEHYEESFEACQRLLAIDDLPSHVRECVEKNLSFTLQKLPAETLLNLFKKQSPRINAV